MNRFGRSAVTAAVISATIGLCLVTIPPSVRAGVSACANVGRRLPIIFVHGFLGHPRDWTSMAQAITRKIPNVYTEEFNYSAYNTLWVSNSNIGPKLATNVACLAQASRQAGGLGKVIIIAHSMGGLAIRYAATETPGASAVAQDLGLVITLGTPNSGNAWARWAIPVLYSACHPVTDHSIKVAVSSSSPCAALSALQGLSGYSAEIKDLPALPRGIPLLGIAGNVTLTTPFFHTKIVDLGSDLVVGEKSALWGRLEGSEGGTSVVSCRAAISTFWHANCWHVNLPHNPTVEQDAIKAIQLYLQLAQKLAPYVGTWYSPMTGAAMSITGTGQASLKWLENAASISFTPSSRGGLVGTVTSAAVGTGFQDGVTETLAMEPDGGIALGGPAADGAGFYRPGSYNEYVGHWEVHDGSLTVDSDDSGTMTWQTGCGQVSCTVNAALDFKFSPTSGLIGTITNVRYPAGASKSDQPQAGDQVDVLLAKQVGADHLLYSFWEGSNTVSLNEGNPYWCSPPGWISYCGA